MVDYKLCLCPLSVMNSLNTLQPSGSAMGALAYFYNGALKDILQLV